MGIFKHLTRLFSKKRKAADIGGMREAVKKLLRTSFLLSFGQEERPSPEGSKFGGRPALPDGFSWPVFAGEDPDGVKEERPLSFLLQINLGEIPDAGGLLPREGMLCFFYETKSMCWGFDPADDGCARVYYFPDLSALSPTEPPAGLLLPERRLHFSPQSSLPDWEELGNYYDVDFSGDAEDYERLRAECGVSEKEEGEDSKFLGYADLIQGDMLAECEQVSRGIYMGGTDAAGDEEDIFLKSRDWTLLLQLGTVELGDVQLRWGDCGRLYFYIRRQDLGAGNFDAVRLILQCT